jgi:hypothetical protein
MDKDLFIQEDTYIYIVCLDGQKTKVLSMKKIILQSNLPGSAFSCNNAVKRYIESLWIYSVHLFF